MKRIFNWARTLGLAGALAVGSAAHAFPERPITLVVSDQAGGPGDVVARALAEQLTTSLRQSVVVENKPGAFGTLGLRAVAQAKPDGHVLGIVFMPHTVSQTLFKGTPYQLTKDFTPLAKVADLFNVLLVRNDLAARHPKELADLSRQKQGGLIYGSGSTGSPAHLSGELFKRQAGIESVHVPFRGPVDALTNLVGGRVDYMFLSMPVAIPMIRAEKVRPLAVTSNRPSSILPNVATMQSSGYPDFLVQDWMGLVGPAGLPPDVQQVLDTALRQAVASPSLKERLAGLGMEPSYADSNEFRGLLDREVSKWAKFIREVGISID